MFNSHLILASYWKDSCFAFADVLGDLATKKILWIPTAANGEDDISWLDEEIAAFRSMGANLTRFDLEEKTEAEVAAALTDTDITYVSGGNTFYLLQHMRASGFEQAIRTFLERGGLYVGSSAGAIVACPDIEYIASLDHPEKAVLNGFAGLNLFDTPVLPHIDHPSFAEGAALIKAAFEQRHENLICLKDSEALHITGAKRTIIKHQ